MISLIDEVQFVPYMSFKAENFGSQSETGLRRRTNEAGERMKLEVVAVKCARGPVVYLYPCRLVSVGVDVARLSLGPESRVAFPLLVSRRFPYQLYPPSLCFTETPLCFFHSHLVPTLLTVPPREMVPTVSRA